MRSYRFHMPFPFYPKRYFSHALIVVAVIVSIVGFIFPSIIPLFWFHHISLGWDSIPILLGQTVLYQFLHADFFHIFMNAYFLYVAGPEVETRMSKNRFITFFITSTLFVALGLYIFAPYSLTIGISGFCMALLSYLWIDLHTLRHPLANQIGILLIINILFWLSGNISFVGHAAGAVWGLIWWQGRKW